MDYRQAPRTKSIAVASLKSVSIHSYSQFEGLREILRKEPIIVIAKISPLVAKHPEAASKAMDELYLSNRENNYSVFRLGEDRIVVIPCNMQVEHTELNSRFLAIF